MEGPWVFAFGAGWFGLAGVLIMTILIQSQHGEELLDEFFPFPIRNVV